MLFHTKYVYVQVLYMIQQITFFLLYVTEFDI